MRRIHLLLLSALLVLPCAVRAQSIDSVEINLKRNVAYLTDSARLGRKAGSAQELDVARYLHNQLEKAGVFMLSPEDGEDFYLTVQGDTIHSRNVIGVVEGYDPKLKNEYVVIGAHYDHLGTSFLKRDGEDQLQIFYGADDNASGVATLVEVAKQVAAQHYVFRRSVIFALFGAEELGMVGSWYFLNRSFSEVDNIVAMINLDMVGRSGRDNRLQVYTADANIELMGIINTLSGRALSIAPQYTPTDYFPSDHRLFYEKGIPVALFTSGVHRDYHTVRDTPDKLDYKQMESLVEYVFAMAQVLSDRDGRIRAASSKRTKEEVPDKGEERVYTQEAVDKRATFLHGTEEQFLNRWVYEYLKYPESAIRNGVEGKVVAEFVVDAKGKVRDVEIVKGVDEELDAQVVKVISASPKWKPAQIKGREVSVKISLPVEFRLTKSPTFKIKK
ncbi:MAG: TonB family protein [Bacteroidales bacterium]|nr:TonB family protein [Bacteroidales bacterium]